MEFTFDQNTRKVTFGTQVCHQCNGAGRFDYGVACPNYGRKMHGKHCKYCGSRNQFDHKMIGTENRVCGRCNGKGYLEVDNFSFCDASSLIPFITVTVMHANRGETLNEGFLGIGLLAGCTDYGASINWTKEQFVDEIVKDCQFTQLGNLVSTEGYLPTNIIVVVRNDGWTSFIRGAQFGMK